MNRFPNIYHLAVITFKEGIRNRALIGVFIISLVMMVMNVAFISFFMRDLGKVSVDLGLSTVSLAGLTLVLFIGLNLISKDLDKKTIFLILSRSVSRTQYLLGKFAGLMVLIIMSMAIIGLVSFLSIFLIKSFLAVGFFAKNFSWLTFFLAWGMSVVSLMTLTAVGFLFCTLTSHVFVAMVITSMVYLIGQSLPHIQELVLARQQVLKVSDTMKMIIQILYYIMPNFSLFDFKLQAAHGLPVDPGHILWAVLYGLVYTTVCLWLADLVFKKKEFV
ncbi:MAG: ABC transporter permease subunit [Deltaproteobacteria bacterium]|nr:ABC transporter permease subunit [Deltaproteobacteria bacterium]